MELKVWLVEKHEQITHRWRAGIRSREGRRGEEGDGILGLVLGHLVSFIPHCLGDNKAVGEEVWHQASYLFGSIALRRALSAGEVVEELGLLRQVLLRLLLEAPPTDWENPGFQRDVLALNRILDQGVVRASVAYVDDLFFAHLQGSGVPEGVTADLEEETMRQMEALKADLAESSRDGLSGGSPDHSSGGWVP